MSVTVHTGDALEQLRLLETASVHAIVTDPPYGLNIGRIAGQHWDSDDTIAFTPELWAEARRVIAPGGLLLAFGASRTWWRLAAAIDAGGFTIEDTILAWSRADKKLVDRPVAREVGKEAAVALDAEGALHTMFKPAHEPIVLARAPFAAGLNRVQNLATYGTGYLNFADAYTPTSEDLSRRPGAPRKGGVMFYDRGGLEKSTPHAGGRYPHNQVFIHTTGCDPDTVCTPDCSAALFDAEHPGKTRYFRSFYHSGRTPENERIVVDGQAHLTVKPVALMQWLVGIATLPGQTVLDPFAGSGSTGIAAAALGRQAVLIERDPSFAAICRERAEALAAG